MRLCCKSQLTFSVVIYVIAGFAAVFEAVLQVTAHFFSSNICHSWICGWCLRLCCKSQLTFSVVIYLIAGFAAGVCGCVACKKARVIQNCSLIPRPSNMPPPSLGLMPSTSTSYNRTVVNIVSVPPTNTQLQNEFHL